MNSRQHTLGRISILSAGLFFYLSTAPVAMAPKELGLSAWQFVFYRMLVGLVVVAVVMSVFRKWQRPNNIEFLIGRGVLNMVSLLAMYKAAELTTAMEANVLNSSYPVFIALILFVWQPSSRDYKGYLLSLVAVAGIFLMMGGEVHLDAAGDFWGVSSAALSALAIISLGLARRGNDTNMVLFFMFLTGTVTLAITGHEQLMIPNGDQASYLIGSAILGVIAQYLLTVGARFVTPVENGVLSSVRILFAVLIGEFILGEKVLTPAEWCGALMIFGANIRMFRRRAVVI